MNYLFVNVVLVVVVCLFAVRYLLFPPMILPSTTQSTVVTNSTTLDICIVSRVSNVASLLPQWLEYHRYLGVGHFLLADDCSNDFDDANFDKFHLDNNSNRVISRTLLWLHIYEYLDYVTVFEDLPFNPCQQESVNGSQQRIPNEGNLISFLTKQAIELGCIYISVLDVDEYILPVHEVSRPKRNSLQSYFIYQPMDTAVLKMPWFMMSSQHRDKIPYELLMIDAYNNGVWDNRQHVKMIVHHSLIRDWRNPHFPFFRRDLNSIDPRVVASWEGPFLKEYDYKTNTAGNTTLDPNWKSIGTALESSTTCLLPTTDWYVRHYHLKSWEEFQYHRLRNPLHAGGIKNYWYHLPNPRATWEEVGNQESTCPSVNQKFITFMSNIVHKEVLRNVAIINADLNSIMKKLDKMYCKNKEDHDVHSNSLRKYSVNDMDILHGKRFILLNCEYN